MKRCFAVLCAVLMVGAISSVAGASPMDSIVWQTYDTFPAPSLNTITLWTVANNSGTLSTGTGGLTLSPISLSDVGKSTLDITAQLTINNGAFFAALVPFSITNGAAGNGGAVNFNITLSSNDYSKASSISWANANNVANGTDTLSGTFFSFSTDHNPQTNIVNIAATTGDLGLIYSGGIITTYYNVGAGWRQLARPIPPRDGLAR